MKKITLIMIFILNNNFAIQSINKTVLLDSQNTTLTQQEQSSNKTRPQDDFYTYANGDWIKNTTIPADKAAWGSFNELQESTTQQLYTVITQINTDKNIDKNSNKQKIDKMYTSFMDESKLDTLGLLPIKNQLYVIDSIKDKQQIITLMGNLLQIGINTPLSIDIHQDAHNSAKEIADIGQNGLGLPDRDYYLKDNDKNLKLIRQKYLKHITKMLSLSGDTSASDDAKTILALETKIAKIQWSKVENRDPVKTYNKFNLNKLPTLMPHFDWPAYLKATKLANKVNYVIISQPSYLANLDNLIQKTPITVWQAYFKWHTLSRFAPLLSKPYSSENFAFYGTTLSGIPKQEPRYKRGINLINNTMGEALGQLYVAKYFPPENKQRIKELVSNLMITYQKSIESLDWMSPVTKIKAQKKLAAITLKIGYPSKWRDYSTLEIKSDDLIGNVIRANKFEYDRNIAKLNNPVDKTEWFMTPQTVNAYYNPEQNEIVFPAAILQPPFFDVKANDATNYGGIGAVIGHEISHGFDDQGSQYDESGNLNNWWTKEDHEKFIKKTKILITQYNSYSPLPGYYVNGKLTLGENIADNSGLSIAYKAFKLHQSKESAIDNTKEDQSFYMGWAYIWRAKVRDSQIIRWLKTDPHSPPKFRGNGTLSNQPGFYRAFNVESRDGMYLSPNKRVTIW